METPLRHRIEFLLLRGLLAVVGRLPSRALGTVGGSLGGLAFDVVRLRRRVALANLGRAFPEWSEAERTRVARAAYTHFGVVFLELMRLGKMRSAELRARVYFARPGQIETLLAAGRGVVIVTGHLGNWEIVGASLGAYGYDASVLVKTQRNRRVDALVTANRESAGTQVLRVESGPRAILRALRKQRIVAIVGDQDAGRHGVFLPHFGEAASVAVGPARFARLAGAPLVVGFCLREPGGRYRVELTEPIEVAPAAGVEPGVSEDAGVAPAELSSEAATARVAAEASERRVLERYLEEMERVIRAHPEQYFWMHRRWKTRPPR